MGKSKQPATPDYAEQARETAAGNLKLAQLQTSANRVNQYNPYGSVEYSQSGLDQYGNPTWSQTTSLNPEQQQLLEGQQQTQLGLSNLQTGLLGNVQDAYSQPFDMQSVQDIADKAYGNYTQRLDPQWEQRQKGLETQLANQGIAPGTEAYTNAMRDFNAGRNDAYTSAQTASFGLMPQTFDLASNARNQPMQELMNLSNATSPNMPQFTDYAKQGQTAGADLLGAANAAYQGESENINARNAQKGGLVSSGLMAAAAFL